MISGELKPSTGAAATASFGAVEEKEEEEEDPEVLYDKVSCGKGRRGYILYIQ